MDEYDLVLLDLDMPRMAGRECFNALRGIDPDVRVVLSTGFDRDGVSQEMLRDGVLCFLQKPAQLYSLSQAPARASH